MAVATPKTLDELKTEIEKLLAKVQDATPAEPITLENTDLFGGGYVACIEAMRDASVLAFNFVASELGVTGFQASVAALQAYGAEMQIEGPFKFSRLEDALYPQYNLRASLTDWINSEDSQKWLKEKAAKQISTHNEADVHPNVWSHWKALAGD